MKKKLIIIILFFLIIFGFFWVVNEDGKSQDMTKTQIFEMSDNIFFTGSEEMSLETGKYYSSVNRKDDGKELFNLELNDFVPISLEEYESERLSAIDNSPNSVYVLCEAAKPNSITTCDSVEEVKEFTHSGFTVFIYRLNSISTEYDNGKISSQKMGISGPIVDIVAPGSFFVTAQYVAWDDTVINPDDVINLFLSHIVVGE